MLVLSRKCRESIIIGEGVTVTILEIKGGRVKLGLMAPSQTPVHRAEVHDKISGSAHPQVSVEPAWA